jgi:serine protease Do
MQVTRHSSVRTTIVTLLAATMIAGCAGSFGTGSASPGAVAPELARFNDLLADLAERLKPALVHVRVRRDAQKEKEERDTDEPRRSQGSGFIVESDGVIVTNAHVVEGAATAQVRLFDGRRFPAKVIGRDNRVDLALLRIEGVHHLPTLNFGDSNRLRVGEFVLALGHPFGLEHSVSFGIVSRKGSPLTVAAPGFDFIQTDAAINPGNSGGPLINMAGEVVGVNSMAARNGSIGFAIPSNLVQKLVPSLLAKGRIEWGWLGVAITEIGDDDLDRLKLREARGVLIRSVMPGEPADRGGVRANDVIVALDGTTLDGPRDLQRLVASAPVGKKIRVTVWREGRETDVEVTVGRYRDLEEREEAPPPRN